MLGFYWDEDPSHMSNWLDCLRGRKQPDRSSRICAIAGLHDGHRRLLVRQENLSESRSRPGLCAHRIARQSSYKQRRRCLREERKQASLLRKTTGSYSDSLRVGRNLSGRPQPGGWP